MFKPGVDHSVTLSYNRAFRSPSIIDNFLNMSIVQAVDLSGLATFRPLLPALLPPGLPPAVAQGALQQLEQQLDQTTAQPFPLVVGVVGSDVPIWKWQAEKGPPWPREKGPPSFCQFVSP